MQADDMAKKKMGYWDGMPTVWAGVGERRRRGLRILPINKGYFVHVTSRTARQAFLFGDEEKRMFVRMMRKWASFSGLSVITYCLMDNHFHVMLWVPAAVSLDHASVLDRLGKVWPEDKVRAWEDFYQNQSEECKSCMEEAVVARMANLPEFMRVLKQSFTCWYNRKEGLSGVLWDARYRSVVVEDSPLALMSVAAYIDLNPLRAGMVQDPMTYAWSGYGSAIKGDELSQQGLKQLVCLSRGHQPYIAEKVRRKQLRTSGVSGQEMGKTLSREQHKREAPAHWKEVQAAYRIWLVNKGTSQAHMPKGSRRFKHRKGMDPVAVIAEYEKQGVVPLTASLQYQMKTFTCGVAVGSASFLEELMAAYRSCFGPDRKQAGRRVKGVVSLWQSLRQVD
ncbi:hypothetical protein P3T73_16040 [Kiritimatiellota bacterium B12222]|nr:hypothetical protein P3T73_16040 [Kiritimatiellota bacterium B12222]